MDLVFEIKLRGQCCAINPFVPTGRDFQTIAVSWWWYISDAKQFKNFKKRNPKKPRDFSNCSQGFSITQKKPSLHHDSLWEETGKGHTVISDSRSFASPLDCVQFYCSPHIVDVEGFSGSSTQLHSTHGPLFGWRKPGCSMLLRPSTTVRILYTLRTSRIPSWQSLIYDSESIRPEYQEYDGVIVIHCMRSSLVLQERQASDRSFAMSNCTFGTRYYELVLVRVDGDGIQGDDVILGATCIGQDITQMKERVNSLKCWISPNHIKSYTSSLHLKVHQNIGVW